MRIAYTGVACGGADAAFKPCVKVGRAVTNGAPEADKSWSAAIDSKLFEGRYSKSKILGTLRSI